MILTYKIVNIRDKMQNGQVYGYLAVDVVWSSENGELLRDDGAKEIADQVNVPLGSSREAIIEAVQNKREDLYLALMKPGVGIVVEAEPISDDLNSLIGKQG